MLHIFPIISRVALRCLGKALQQVRARRKMETHSTTIHISKVMLEVSTLAYISQAADFGLQRAVCQEFGRINDTLGALQESIANLGLYRHSSCSRRSRDTSNARQARQDTRGHRPQARHHDRPHMRHVDEFLNRENAPPPQGQQRRWVDSSSSSPSPPR